MKGRTNVVPAIIAAIAVAGLAVWQFYQYVTFRNASGVVDLQGGHLHFWFAIGLAVIACVIGFLSFSAYLRYDRGDEMHITSQGS